MSIDENVGGMSRYLNKIRVGQVYNGVKSGVEKSLLNIPGIGEGVARVVKRGKDSIKEFFDSIAPKWDNEPIADKKILDIILDNGGIRENIDILDVACGTGVLFPYYLERNVKSITAIDLSPEMVKIAKSKFPQANVICGDAENIILDKQFDAIMIYNAFPHFPEPEKVIESLSKALKTGGRFTIAHGLSKKELDGEKIEKAQPIFPRIDIKKELDEIHQKSAGAVSNVLPECDDLAKMLSPYFNVDIMISDDKMYQISGTKR